MTEAVQAMIDSVHEGVQLAPSLVAAFVRWLRAHRGAVRMAGVLSFAAPATFFASALSAMPSPRGVTIVELAAWFVLLGVELWVLLLVIGYVLQQIRGLGRYGAGATLFAAGVAAGVAELSNGRGRILVEQGVVQSTHSMHAYAFVFALVMALLFFAHLSRSRAQEEAAVRLAAAQAAQRETRRRLAQARLQAVQARIDPQLLFEMLDSVRRAYEEDPSRAERLLDELASFLRAALPRLRSTSSSVIREARLAHAYAQLRTLMGTADVDMRLDVPAAVADARFPPGVLLPLLGDALRSRAGACGLRATRSPGNCEVELTLPAPPFDAVVARVRALLADLYGTSAELVVAHAHGLARATVKVPYESALG